IGPLLALLAIGARSDTGTGALWYAVQLVQTRTIPPQLALLIGAGGGLVTLLLLAALGRVASPALPRLRNTWLEIYDGQRGFKDLVPVGVRAAGARLAGSAVRLRVPTRSRTTAPGSKSGTRSHATRARTSPVARTPVSNGRTLPPTDERLERARLRAEARSKSRSRVKSR
ncbi:MAG: hypothetical protein ABI200_02480, partial [Gaiellales bacterium]